MMNQKFEDWKRRVYEYIHNDVAHQSGLKLLEKSKQITDEMDSIESRLDHYDVDFDERQNLTHRQNILIKELTELAGRMKVDKQQLLKEGEMSILLRKEGEENGWIDKEKE